MRTCFTKIAFTSTSNTEYTHHWMWKLQNMRINYKISKYLGELVHSQPLRELFSCCGPSTLAALA